MLMEYTRYYLYHLKPPFKYRRAMQLCTQMEYASSRLHTPRPLNPDPGPSPPTSTQEPTTSFQPETRVSQSKAEPQATFSKMSMQMT